MADSRIRQPPRFRYPWKRWTNGRWHKLTHPEDINVNPYVFRSLAYQWSKRNGYKAQVRNINNDSLELRITACK